jgi:hypothetical protein
LIEFYDTVGDLRQASTEDFVTVLGGTFSPKPDSSRFDKDKFIMSNGKFWRIQFNAFYKSNSKSRKNCIPDKIKHSFFFCINGSGMGKTWLGRYLCLKVCEEKQGHDILLDFFNGDKHDLNITDSTSEMLGFRIAAHYFFSMSAMKLYDLCKTEGVFPNKYLFNFGNVMSLIHKHRSSFIFCIQLDELQLCKDVAKEILHIIGNYMVETNNNIIILPIITATSSVNFGAQLTGYP